MNKPTTPSAAIRGEEHWTSKGSDVKLFMWEKCAGDPAQTRGTILFVHGSSMASQPTFDLQVPGRNEFSAMDFFAARGFDTWCVDMEGYGRSTKTRDNNAPISYGADDCFEAATYIQKLRGKRPFRRWSAGSSRAGSPPALPPPPPARRPAMPESALRPPPRSGCHRRPRGPRATAGG